MFTVIKKWHRLEGRVVDLWFDSFRIRYKRVFVISIKIINKLFVIIAFFSFSHIQAMLRVPTRNGISQGLCGHLSDMLQAGFNESTTRQKNMIGSSQCFHPLRRELSDVIFYVIMGGSCVLSMTAVCCTIFEGVTENREYEIEKKRNYVRSYLHLILRLLNEEVYQSQEFNILASFIQRQSNNFDAFVNLDALRVYFKDNCCANIYNIDLLDNHLIEVMISEMIENEELFFGSLKSCFEEIISLLLKVRLLKNDQDFVIDNHKGLQDILNYSPLFIHIVSKVLNQLSRNAQEHGRLNIDYSFFDRTSIFCRLNPQQQDEFLSIIQDSDISLFVLDCIGKNISEKSKAHLTAILKNRASNSNGSSLDPYFE